jgi:hypothetical protein
VLLTNVRFLAGYRRSWLFSEDLLHEVLAALGDDDTFRWGIHRPSWPAL